MMLKTVTFQPLTSLRSWYMLCQKQAIIADGESAKHTCKSHIVSAESYLFLFVSNTWYGYWYIIIQLKYNTNLKIYNTKVGEITFLLSSAVCTLCSLVSKQRFARNFSFLSNNCQKTGNTRTGTGIVNSCTNVIEKISLPCVHFSFCLIISMNHVMGGLVLMFDAGVTLANLLYIFFVNTLKINVIK